jgi:hypothetical protein
MTKRPIQVEAAETILDRPLIFPPDVLKQARQTLQELWLPQLRKQMADAHPDRGGTVSKFTAARLRNNASAASPRRQA